MVFSIDKEWISLCLLSVLLLTASCTGTERRKGKEVVHQTFASFVEVDSVRYDFGELKADEGSIKHRFILKNKSRFPLYISEVVSGCGCMKADYTSNPFATGDTASVSVTFIPGSMKGVFDKSILILLNDGKYYLSVSIHGTIP